MKRVRFLTIVILILTITISASAQKKLTLEDIFKTFKFRTNTLIKQWLSDEDAYTTLKYDSLSRSMAIYKYDLKSGKEEKIVSYAELDSQIPNFSKNVSAYFFSPNKKFILFTGSLPARRLKTGGNFYLYDIQTKTLKQITNTEEPQAIIKFSPDSRFISFVRNNNIFVYEISTGNFKQLTFDGSETILNGLFDWVYEEEFSIIDGYEWSPDGRHIAFWRLDQSKVPVFKLIDYEPTYLNVIDQRYPYAGYPNSTVKIGIVNVQTGDIKYIDFGDEDIYIPRVNWTRNPDILSYQKLNRLQNKLELIFYNIKTGEQKLILTEESNTWVDVHDYLTFLKDGRHFIWASERDGWLHLYLYRIDGKLINQITEGTFEIDQLCFVDEKNRKIYYTSTEVSPLERHLYVIDFKGLNKKKLSVEAGWHNVDFSPSGSFYIDNHSTITRPPKWKLYSYTGKFIRTLVDNPDDILAGYDKGEVTFEVVETSDGVKLNAWMIKPANFDSTRKYPVLFYVYGGPGSQTVRNAFLGNYAWYQYLAQNGYIIFSVDGRGTGARGKSFRDVIYKNLGYYESKDQAEAALYLIKKYKFVDSSRIGIWGWSYGGYMSSLTLFKFGDIFKLAVAVAPVTTWRLYDTIYTERYMQTPELNPEGYEQSSVLKYADTLKGKYLVIHGTTDDNVHWQNTIQLVDKLQKAGKQFNVMFYPNKDHSIAGRDTRYHLFTLITNFILENL
ncbi:dipeptidyl-peptidase-4 [Candidatus Kryptonium thompsonii]|uniref:Dipeptidyl-peptidase-4 n=2 Tax=Candidatus Kryptonium thompsonii TaxID=1633631 RepID=A0A0P1LNI5_9BACT|nr:S9 family peptidase [Candidatus Kryptonium thompsoni]CUS80437.1 dipeptidyl-peptidase-4 [Candidatus Kryptonium thompsoni]CUS82209.1 dipeptidyl-peptidase-4 [Candidatus Kryptonium thompsoni]CUS83263.1 dipeptidyl-peptidase-4 [Candidatus Kryptonium thompsoni]CUS85791.1 dipeptidyl-peptidase-4 [Candidatus Kryptonium thompsoni]CUT02190.1 dipeptidyl-peptidase-4 [Candidatus Kryptonium thompsoni]